MAQASEIENVESVVKLWREMAQKMSDDRATLATQVEELSTEVRRLKNLYRVYSRELLLELKWELH